MKDHGYSQTGDGEGGVNDGGAGGNRKKHQTHRLTKEVEGGMQGRGPPKHLCAVDEAFVAMLSPPPVELRWALIPSHMIHEHWSSLLTRTGPQPKPSAGLDKILLTQSTDQQEVEKKPQYGDLAKSGTVHIQT
ncbi:hypothetical protein PAMP_023189 [Pampus punctatissimus]